MEAVVNNPAVLTTTETLIIGILKQEGAHTFETLLQRSGLDWSQVFMAIDHLSRLGKVSLHRLQGKPDYVLMSHGKA
jgi:DNA-binding MarR family transcriptional regulator